MCGEPGRPAVQWDVAVGLGMVGWGWVAKGKVTRMRTGGQGQGDRDGDEWRGTSCSPHPQLCWDGDTWGLQPGDTATQLRSHHALRHHTAHGDRPTAPGTSKRDTQAEPTTQPYPSPKAQLAKQDLLAGEEGVMLEKPHLPTAAPRWLWSRRDVSMRGH